MSTSSPNPAPKGDHRPAEPVGFYCDHSDERADARTHHDWEFVEGEGFVFTHQPDILSSHSSTHEYLKPEQREKRCPRAVPVYAVDVPELIAELQKEKAEREADRRTWQHDLGQLREARAEIDRLRGEAKRALKPNVERALIKAAVGEALVEHHGAADLATKVTDSIVATFNEVRGESR